MANSRDGDKEYLESVLGSPAGRKSSLLSRWWRKFSNNGFHKKHLERIRRMLLDSGSVEYSMDVAFRFAEMAKRNLEAIPDSSARQSLISLADHVMTREC
jgi:geranylgeranyl pyrophosphate synthase